MKKLFNLREWLTLQEAAKYLSIVFDDSVDEADVLRLGLDGHLMLSVNFVNGASGKIGHIVKMTDAKMLIFPGVPNISRGGSIAKNVRISEVDDLPDEVRTGLEDGSLVWFPMGDVIDEHSVIEYEDRITSLTGVWDLPMLGGEKLDVEHTYQRLTGGPAVTLTCLDGAFVKSPKGEFANIQESFDNNEFQKGSSAYLEKLKQRIIEDEIPKEKADSMLEEYNEDRRNFLEDRRSKPPIENYYPSGGLPEDSVFVIRTSALRALEQSLHEHEASPPKELAPTERNSLLTIIAALCDHAKIDLSARGAAVNLAKLTEQIGAPISDDTVRRALEKLPDAVESRTR